MRVELSGDTTVIRFTPTSPERLLRKAELSNLEYGYFGLSVFADARRPTESHDALLARLLKAAELSGIAPERNPKYFVCARAAELTARGFSFVKDGYPGEVPEHYTVDLGHAPTVETVTSFTGAFDDERRR